MELTKVSELIGITPAANNFGQNRVQYPDTNNFALKSPDMLFNSRGRTNNYSTLNIFGSDNQLLQLQNKSVQNALKEWQSGVRENLGPNQGTRVNLYYKNADFRAGNPNSGGWCGFFTAFSYAQAGFKYSPNLASMEKARDFFMYRQYTDRSKDKHASLDSLKSQHQAQGSQRQFFMLEESPARKYIKSYSKIFNNFNADSNTFNYRTLPVRAGDTILFDTGNPGGHVGMVESYNKNTGMLTTIEGNATGLTVDGKKRSGAVVKKTYDLTDPKIRARIEGFGRPAAGDFI